MKLARHLVFLASVAISQPVAAATPLCEVIKKFEGSAPEPLDDPHQKRWIEFHWGFDRDPDTMWSWGCRHSKQMIASQTCHWLEEHTNQEFAMALPQGTMQCYGYKFPKYALTDWSRIAGAIKLRGRAKHHLLLELNYRDLPNGEVAIRLSVEALNEGTGSQEMPPIEPMPLIRGK
ncbi:MULTISPECIES: hypothetical protein [unclassified Novosphingobium]|uniref:hypothetical protein n=1 Tax=unclassified Novosphingobium TaxID=2644732 RepID=UPI001493E0C9|nr:MULTISPECIES: hypothetical protein [unclassified Novosphingobium]MBB3359867.1 hypothetical protein [Novosphingobium sp. BK256]MBB3376226.1 hypothetical protein [Novosphingobium sp. BK280]MBB3380640.1 hypothetical protein [Novosphingobium sp. BK258]MBB3422364.1 hypothetical protein [Novosphingobium sp. BK267]MBB3451064.1 hypothetical protein [Novosphingobium sp. BK352]